jgi:glycosyltransferase involved in cell wall biosynthesis
MGKVDVSICIATWNKAGYLRNTLKSIRDQDPKVNYEIVVVDDGSSDDTRKVCQDFDVVYEYLDRPTLKNPAVPRNRACEIAKGEVLLMQSDDVVHMPTSYVRDWRLSVLKRNGQAIPPEVENINIDLTPVDLLYEVPKKGVHFAACLNVRLNAANPIASKTIRWYINWWKFKRPLFFIGSMHKDDFWAVGGNNEGFIYPGHEDDYLGHLLCEVYGEPHGEGITWRDDVIGFHQNHKKRLSGHQKSAKRFNRLMQTQFPREVQDLKTKIYGED